jgi:energy-coupling factor transporter ATP-binding protein EcfA2
MDQKLSGETIENPTNEGSSKEAADTGGDPPKKPVIPSLYVSGLNFSDGTSLELGPTDTVLIVGPNNVGKSEVLRALHGKAANQNTPSPVLSVATFQRIGDAAALERWLDETSRVSGTTPNRHFRRLGGAMGEGTVKHTWSNKDHALNDAANIFFTFARTEGRIHDSNPPQQVNIHEPPSHPLHNLNSDADLEARLSSKFKEAFGKELVVNWRAGQSLPLHVGARPQRTAVDDRVSNAYVKKVEALPRLDAQGDGMRSFVTLLLASHATDASILLVDEPEAFLHPPQAKLAGELLAKGGKSARQTFVATHSSDVVRGMLTANPSTRVVRLTRAGEITKAHVVPTESIEKLWSDPLLRYSNALDGLFHDAVIICEADADCRFYEAVLQSSERKEKRIPPDLLFTFTSGKSRMGNVKAALRSAGVRAIAVPDLDVLREDKPLVELLPPDAWDAIKAKVLAIRTALNAKLPSIPRSEVAERISKIVFGGSGEALSDRERNAIKEILRGTSIWTMVKSAGLSAFPGGAISVQAIEVLKHLWDLDVAVVPAGEMEGFCKTVTADHGPAWVEEALRRDLAADPELAEARAFVKRIAENVRSPVALL